MKIILISGCNRCPHGAKWNLYGDEYMCSQLFKVNKNPQESLPDCPLADAVETIKEMFKPDKE